MGGLVAGAALWAAPAFAFSVPSVPTGYVNDYAHVLSAEAVSSLESELATFTASTTSEVAIAIVPDMGGDYVEHYATDVFQRWGVGTKKNDNGVLLLLSVSEHKIRIEVGYGLEGALPDSVAQNIIATDLTPRLKAGDYDTAVTSAVHDIMSATAGEYQAPASATASTDIGNIIWFVFVFGILALQWLGAILGRSKSWWLGGVLGAVVGVGVSTVFGWWLLSGAVLSVLLTLAGLFFDYVVSSTTSHATKYGVDPPWWAGGGGFGGGSSSGGSFGGFGGGSSGGGGASGGW